MPSAAYTGWITFDLVNVFKAKQGRTILTTLAWGDEVKVTGRWAGGVTVSVSTVTADGSVAQATGFIKAPSKASGISIADIISRVRLAPGVMKVDFVDVQQGDGAVIETP